jgi:hypothetical protein
MILAIAMVVIGSMILFKMLAYGVAGFTGIVLGAAMIALGLYRINQLRAIWGRR